MHTIGMCYVSALGSVVLYLSYQLSIFAESCQLSILTVSFFYLVNFHSYEKKKVWKRKKNRQTNSHKSITLVTCKSKRATLNVFSRRIQKVILNVASILYLWRDELQLKFHFWTTNSIFKLIRLLSVFFFFFLWGEITVVCYLEML